MKKLFIALAAVLGTAAAVAQELPIDVLDKVVLDLFHRQAGVTLCMTKEISNREALRAALAPRLAGIDLNDASTQNAIAKATYTEFPCPFTPYRSELRAATKEEIAGTWLFPESAQRLRFGPKSPNWKAEPGMPAVRCEGIAYLPNGDALVAQVRGAMACPTAQDIARLTNHQTVEHWSYLSGGRIKIDRTDSPGYEEEWETFVVQTGFDFAGDHFSQGDLLAYRRREPGNTFEASTLFRHLQRIDAAVHDQTDGFDRFTKDLSRLLETDATTVMARGLTFDFGGKICSRLANPTGEEAQREVAEWRKRNDAYFRGATSVLNEFGERYRAVGGESAKQRYFHMILEVTGKEANENVMRQLGGANLDNAVVPPERACFGLAHMLRDGVVDFVRTPGVTQALVPYMEQKDIQ